MTIGESSSSIARSMRPDDLIAFSAPPSEVNSARGDLLTNASVAEHTYMVIQLGILAAFIGS